MRIGIDDNKKRGIKKNRINIKIIGIVRSLFTVGNRVLSFQRLRVALSVMVIIKAIDQIGDFSLIIDICLLMCRSEVEHQYMIGWGQAQCA